MAKLHNAHLSQYIFLTLVATWFWQMYRSVWWTNLEIEVDLTSAKIDLWQFGSNQQWYWLYSKKNMANFYSDTMECIYYSLLDSTIRYDKKVFENMTLLCIWSFMYHKFIPHNDFYKVKLIVTHCWKDYSENLELHFQIDFHSCLLVFGLCVEGATGLSIKRGCF